MIRSLPGWLMIPVFLSQVACSDREPAGPDGGDKPAALISGFLVSDPRSPGTNSLVDAERVSAAAANQSVVADESVVYVSLIAGTLPDATTVQVSNPRNNFTITIPVISGGFDPVQIPAVAYDELNLAFSTGSGSVRLNITVPPRRPPAIVRTTPSKGRTDVALSVSVEIVFSEPIDPATANTTNVRLLKNGVAVPSRVIMVADSLTAVLIPNSPLEPRSSYELVVSQGVKDLSGDALEASYSGTFATGSGGSTLSLGSRLPDNGWMMTDDTVTVSAVVRNVDGTVLTGGTIAWSVSPNTYTASIEATSPRTARIRVIGDRSFRLTATFTTASAGLVLNVAKSGKFDSFGQGFIWSDSEGMTQIPRPYNVVSVDPVAINDRGDVVGTMYVFSNVDGGTMSRAFIWSKSAGFTEIARATPTEISSASGIDSNGLVVGSFGERGGRGTSFIWTRERGRQSLDFFPNRIVVGAGWVAGTLSARPFRWPMSGPVENLEFPKSANAGEVYAINDSGEAVGYDGFLDEINDAGPSTAVFWDKAGTRQDILPCEAGLVCYGAATAINNHGQAVGNRSTSRNPGEIIESSSRVSFRWSRETGATILGVPPGFAEFGAVAINDSGDVIGIGRGGLQLQVRPILIRASGAVVNLGTLPGMRSATATAMNNRGEIVGVSTRF